MRKRVSAKILTTQDRLQKVVSKPAYVCHKAVREYSMYIVPTEKNNILLNKTIYCGMAILQASKRSMFYFHYNHMMKTFCYKDCGLCFTDTDRLLYYIKHQPNTNMHDILLTGEDSKLFDTSNNPKDSDK